MPKKTKVYEGPTLKAIHECVGSEPADLTKPRTVKPGTLFVAASEAEQNTFINTGGAILADSRPEDTPNIVEGQTDPEAEKAAKAEADKFEKERKAAADKAAKEKAEADKIEADKAAADKAAAEEAANGI